MKKPKFILVNNSILDFDVYKEDFQRLACTFKPEIFEIAGKYNFELMKLNSRSEFNNWVIFYNLELDMELVVVVRKRNKPGFV
ncbi:TPA: hypothetical protein HA231_03315 [Candidatus Woesearchaeota archaeon]|nr:hypothetical protein [Candidatus Woesearchaeota archaeon]